MTIRHLDRLSAIVQRVAELDEEIASATAILNHLPFGVILLDSSGRLLRANRFAQRLLEQRDGLSNTPDGLSATRLGETSKLRRLTARAAQAGASDSVLLLHRPSGRRALQVLITSARDGTAGPWHVRRCAAALFVADPDDPAAPTVDGLRVTYGLTAAQARVAVWLSEGLALREIAERARVQVNTVRAHLKQIFAKTGTRRQVELVRLLLHGALALAPQRLPCAREPT